MRRLIHKSRQLRTIAGTPKNSKNDRMQRENQIVAKRARVVHQKRRPCVSENGAAFSNTLSTPETPRPNQWVFGVYILLSPPSVAQTRGAGGLVKHPGCRLVRNRVALQIS